MSPSPSPSPPRDASRFPLIRDILATYTPPRRRDDSSSWLSSPGVVAAVQRTMPPGYGSSGDKMAVDGAGQLLVWGAPRAAWECCLRVRGLRWATLRADLADLMAGHDVYVSCAGWCVVVVLADKEGCSVEQPVVVGDEDCFIALVYMASVKGAENAIADLDGAEVAREMVLRVALATEADLESVLVVGREQMRRRG